MKKYLLSLLLSLIIPYVFILLFLTRSGTIYDILSGNSSFMEPIYVFIIIYFSGLFEIILLISMILGLSFGIYKILNKYSK